MLWRDGSETAGFAMAGLALLLCGEASPWLLVLAGLPLFQLLPGDPPVELAAAMAAARVRGPGTIAADPAALWTELSTLAGCLTVFALARTGAQRSSSAAWWAVAGVAAFGCFEGALGVASGVGATPASGTLVNRGQYAALLELSLGAGCGLAAAAWAGRSWPERLDEKALLGAVLGFGAAALSLVGIGLSLSRTGIVVGGLAAVAGAAWFGRKNVWALVTVIVVAAALALGAPRALDRFEQLAAAGGDPGRTAIWADSFDLARGRWLTGAGFGSFPSVFKRSSFYLPRKSIDNAHSDYLETALELGFPAAALLIGSIGLGLAGAARRARTSPLAAGCLLGVGAVLLHATVDLPLQLPGLAALMAALLGLASAQQSRDRKGAGRLSAAVLGGALIALSGAPVESAQDLYLAAGEASAAGDQARAQRLYRAALDRNVSAAPTWLRLAEIERGRGEIAGALLFARAARKIEPYTLRTEWSLAELELETGDAASAQRRFAGLLVATPDLLDAALRTASRSGAPPDELRTLVPANNPEAAGRYLAFLVRSNATERLPEAYASLGEPELPQRYRDWLRRKAGFLP